MGYVTVAVNCPAAIQNLIHFLLTVDTSVALKGKGYPKARDTHFSPLAKHLCLVKPTQIREEAARC